MYVIKRNDGAYVAPPGSEHSYTFKLEDAWTFSTRERAERHRCPENETVVLLEDIVQRPFFFD